MLLTLANLVVLLAALSLSQVTVWATNAPRGPGTLILLGGVLAAYTLDGYVDADQARRAAIRPQTLSTFIIAGGAIAAGLWAAPHHAPLVAALALVAAVYAPLKRFVPKGVVNAAAWSAAVVWLPCATTPPLSAAAKLAACTFVLVAANAILCDTLDVDADRANGVRGLAPWLGPRRAAHAAALFASAAALLAIALGLWPIATAAFPLACAAFVPHDQRRRDVRRILIDLLVLIPGIVCAAAAHRVA